MPRIILKPGSPEYADERPTVEAKACDMPDCVGIPQHKAPRHRGLDEYYNFCHDHIREYNKAWNFFDGMAEREVQEHIYKSRYGDRPTWRFGIDGENPEDHIRRKIHETYGGSYDRQEDDESKRQEQHRSMFGVDRNTPEFEALNIMGLAPPIKLDGIKARYKALAKKHHPDLNPGCDKSEERLKQINMAYTILKLAYENFEKLPQT